MYPNLQAYLTVSVPSVLVILSWIHNNTRLNRLEAGQDALNKRTGEVYKRMDSMVASFHNGMMNFQASILEAVYQIRERVTVLEAKAK